jgi:sucrose-6-phosphate hydrolase SacC (GH32 family)
LINYFCPIRDEDLKKHKLNTPIKEVKSKTSQDSPPVKKSRRKVGRILEDSSDEENETMDTNADKLKSKTNGYNANDSESITNEDKENGIVQATSSHTTKDEKMPSTSPSSGDIIPKRTTGLLDFMLINIFFLNILLCGTSILFFFQLENI